VIGAQNFHKRAAGVTQRPADSLTLVARDWFRVHPKNARVAAKPIVRAIKSSNAVRHPSGAMRDWAIQFFLLRSHTCGPPIQESHTPALWLAVSNRMDSILLG